MIPESFKKIQGVASFITKNLQVVTNYFNRREKFLDFIEGVLSSNETPNRKFDRIQESFQEFEKSIISDIAKNFKKGGE